MLLDCGESTTSQINKYYANEADFNLALCRIKAVYISHCHLDHFYGLFGLINRRRQAFEKLGLVYEKLFIMHPRILLNEIKGGSSLFFNNFNNLVVLIQNDSISDRKLSEVKEKLELRMFKNVLVDHIPYSYACVIELNDANRLETLKNFTNIFSSGKFAF